MCGASIPSALTGEELINAAEAWLSHGLQAEGIKKKKQCFTAEAKRSSNVNSGERDREEFFFLCF